MWFYIDGELTDHGDFVVSLRPADVELPAGWEYSTNTPMPKFSVRLRGARRRLQLFSADGIAFHKQAITNPQPKQNPINIKPKNVEVESFEVLNITPKNKKDKALTLFPTAHHIKHIHTKTTSHANPKY